MQSIDFAVRNIANCGPRNLVQILAPYEKFGQSRAKSGYHHEVSARVQDLDYYEKPGLQCNIWALMQYLESSANCAKVKSGRDQAQIWSSVCNNKCRLKSLLEFERGSSLGLL